MNAGANVSLRADRSQPRAHQTVNTQVIVTFTVPVKEDDWMTLLVETVCLNENQPNLNHHRFGADRASSWLLSHTKGNQFATQS